MATVSSLVSKIIQNMFSCVQPKKETHAAGLELLFWVNYHFTASVESCGERAAIKAA